MRIKQLKLENFRGFEELTIDFPEKGSAVFIGENGAGKSSLLAAISIFLLDFVQNITHSKYETSQKLISDFDINIDVNDLKNDISISYDFDNKSKSIIDWSVLHGLNYHSNYQSTFTAEGHGDFIERLDACLEKEEKTAFPILSHYSVARHFANTTSEISNKDWQRFRIPQFKAYAYSFYEETDFQDFLKWFIEEENKENREKIAKKDFKITNPNLEPVRKALSTFFSNLSNINLYNLRVEERKFNTITNVPSSLVITKDGNDLNLVQLSDGEKLMLLIVIDIARRLAIANPALEDKLTGKGVVLVDEIELHLHPKWQRTVIPALEKTFPNIQFIFTTHSPQVLSNVQRENVFMLKDFKVMDFTPHTFGRDSNSILYDLFGVEERPEHGKKDIEQLYQLIDKNDKAAAEKKFAELQNQFGSEDVEMMRAQQYIDLMDE